MNITSGVDDLASKFAAAIGIGLLIGAERCDQQRRPTLRLADHSRSDSGDRGRVVRSDPITVCD